MILVIDVGNTNVVIGIYRGNHLIHHWRLSTDRTATSDEYGIMLHNLFHIAGVQMRHIDGVIVSSVVPPLMYVLEKLCLNYIKKSPIIVGPGIKTGLNIRYENPREVGADRIVNSVAAIELYGTPVIVVDFGTAITVDYVDEKGEYIGGAIAPGISIATEALYQSAAKLPRIELVKPKSVIGRNSINSMQAGIIYGYAGLVDGIVTRIRKQFSISSEARVVATGGLADLIADESSTIELVNPLLTLEGLRIIYERNISS